MDRNPQPNQRLEARRSVGSVFGYAGMFLGLMALLATTSEGTPFQRHEAAWVLFAFMALPYVFGWLIGPKLAGDSQTR